VTNLSPKREIVVTHVWVEANPDVQILNSQRPLPARLKTDAPWETWVALDALPSGTENVEWRGRVRLSTRKVLRSRLSPDVPPAGFVPNG